MIVEQALRYPPAMTQESTTAGDGATAGTQRLALWAAAATGVQVGAATVASRYAVAELAPLTLAFLRYAIAVVCLLPFVASAWSWRGLRSIVSDGAKVRDWLAMGALGLGQFGILIALLNFGLQHVTAASAALIFSLFPLLTLLLSAAMGRERITPALLLGVLLSIGGVALSLTSRLQASAGHAGWLGELAVLGAAAVGALCSVLYRPYLRRYPTIQVSVFAMAASVVFLGLAALSEHWPQRVISISGPAWAAVGFVGISSAVGYVWWLYALKHLPPTRVTIFLALNPVTAALLGQLLLGERMDLWTVAAIGAIALGLWLGTRSPAPT
jgi:drug/metabolite transporter (DMT)-like permease